MGYTIMDQHKHYTGCPNKFGMAQTAGEAEVVISASKSGTQGGYTMVPWPPA